MLIIHVLWYIMVKESDFDIAKAEIYKDLEMDFSKIDVN